MKLFVVSHGANRKTSSITERRSKKWNLEGMSLFGVNAETAVQLAMTATVKPKWLFERRSSRRESGATALGTSFILQKALWRALGPLQFLQIAKTSLEMGMITEERRFLLVQPWEL
jgi:hypothetical protein